MQNSTTVRVTRTTRDQLRWLADQDGLTLDETLARLARTERQRRIGQALAAEGLTATDSEWLDQVAQTVIDAGG